MCGFAQVKGDFMIKPLTLLVLSALALNVHAKVDSAQAARLGQDLTPLGAERAGNIAGTIPEWTGGITGRLPSWNAPLGSLCS